MYLTFDQVILVRATNTVCPDDLLVYVRQHPNLGRVLIMDETQVQRELGWGTAFEYGHIYEDAQGNLCVIPNLWDEDDALYTKDWRETNE